MTYLRSIFKSNLIRCLIGVIQSTIRFVRIWSIRIFKLTTRIEVDWTVLVRLQTEFRPISIETLLIPCMRLYLWQKSNPVFFFEVPWRILIHVHMDLNFDITIYNHWEIKHHFTRLYSKYGCILFFSKRIYSKYGCIFFFQKE